MSEAMHPTNRLHELLADRATTGLDANELHELNGLGSDWEREALEFELAAAAADLAFAQDDAPLPSHLRDRLESVGVSRLATDRGLRLTSLMATVETKLSSPQFTPAPVPWLVAAAAVVLAAFAWVFAPSPGPANISTPDLALTPAQRYESLLAQTGSISSEWAVADESLADGATGGAVWDAETQTGLMKFAGLPINDPTEQQYQLWIFRGDAEGGLEAHPVDGGVFDIASADSDVYVPIDARLQVDDVVAFAITIEPPGGVVVSDRSRLPLLGVVEEG